MSKSDEPGPGRRLQEWNSDFDALVYKPWGLGKGTVLNTAKQPPTLYRTDIKNLECQCDHNEYNQGPGPVCKHLAKAMLAHPDFEGSAELMARDMSALVDRAAQAVRELEDSRDVAQATASAETASASTQDDTSETESTVGLMGEAAVEAVDEWLDENTVVYPALTVEEAEHDGDPVVAIRVDYDGISEAQKEGFKSTINAVDESGVHVGFTDDGCQSCGLKDDDFYYFVPEDDVEEALA